MSEIDKIPDSVIGQYDGINRASGRSNFSKNITINGKTYNKAKAARDTYRDIETNTSIRDSFTRLDYEEFRPEESVASNSKDIIRQCMNAYRKVGIIRNVIDLMADFGSQGISLVHPNKSTQKFYRDWFAKVSGPDRSERFLNLLYRCGNVIIRRVEAKINNKIAKNLTSYAKEPPVKISEKGEIIPNIIPWRILI